MLKPVTTLEEFELEYNKGLGREIDLNNQRFLTEVTRDNILNFADAIGDNNPLWINEDYATKSRFGGLTAPPTFLFNINHGTLPAHSGTIQAPIDLVQLYSGAEIESFHTILPGDKINVKGKALSLVRKQVKRSDRFSLWWEKLAIITRTTCCLVRFAPPFAAIELPGSNQLKSIIPLNRAALICNRRIFRHMKENAGGHKTLLGDVVPGEEMSPFLEKGVLTMSEITRFGFLVSPLPRRIEARREAFEPGFERANKQKKAGLENASDYGPQRICWLGQFVTDWMGDDATLKKLAGQVRHPNIIGDSSVIKGRVIRKYVQNGEHLVECEIGMENQAGLVTAPGSAVVALPTRTNC
jgi:hypothetical protein